MPPLMGAGAFVMVELTGIPYADIIVAAALPALLYFFAVWIGVDIYALRFGLRPLNRDARPAVRTVLITASFFLIPFSVLLIVMYIGFTPQYAAAVAILAATLLLFINGSMAIQPWFGYDTHLRCSDYGWWPDRHDRVDYSMRINHHWRSRDNRPWDQGDLADFVFFGRHDLASLAADRACLFVPRHGGANNSGLCDLRFSCRASID